MVLLQRILAASLLIVASVTSVSAANLPAFSWETVPRWGFFSFSRDAVTAGEVRYIADDFRIATLFWIPRGSVLRYDVSNPELQEWWSEQAANASQIPYIDGLPLSASHTESTLPKLLKYHL